MKISFLSYQAEHENVKFVVNRNNNYMCVKTENLKLLDISNYLATGFSYVQFLKAYGCSEEKGHFPCEWMTTLEKLKHTALPPKEAFYSSLRNQHISEGDYQHCLDMWQQHNMSTMRDVLVWYNKDVEPMPQAIDKMFIYFRNQRLEMFNDGISVPGLTLKYMFQDLPNYFTIPDKRNNDLHRLLKENILGDPSIVLHRYHERNVTTIRPAEYDDTIQCKKIISFDANALYLWSIMENMPTGHFVRRKMETEFERDSREI